MNQVKHNDTIIFEGTEHVTLDTQNMCMAEWTYKYEMTHSDVTTRRKQMDKALWCIYAYAVKTLQTVG